MFYKRVVLILFFPLLTVSSLYSNNIKLSFLKPNNYFEKQIKNSLNSSDSLDILIDTLNSNFTFKKEIVIEIGRNTGPLYENKTNKILIPYIFYQETYDMFKEAEYEKTGITLKEATIDVFIQTILHELAHAIIKIHNLPIVGKEEDIADSFAAIILIEFFKNGDEILLTSSDAFKLYSNKYKFNQEDFIDEHSLDIQRFYDSICYVYGSYPIKYKNLLKSLNYSEDRKLLCEEDYIKNVNNWFHILRNYLNKNRT